MDEFGCGSTAASDDRSPHIYQSFHVQSKILWGHIVDCLAEIVDNGHSRIGFRNDWDGNSLIECADNCHQLFWADGTVDAHSAGSGAF